MQPDLKIILDEKNKLPMMSKLINKITIENYLPNECVDMILDYLRPNTLQIDRPGCSCGCVRYDFGNGLFFGYYYCDFCHNKLTTCKIQRRIDIAAYKNEYDPYEVSSKYIRTYAVHLLEAQINIDDRNTLNKNKFRCYRRSIKCDDCQ